MRKNATSGALLPGKGRLWWLGQRVKSPLKLISLKDRLRTELNATVLSFTEANMMLDLWGETKLDDDVEVIDFTACWANGRSLTFQVALLGTLDGSHDLTRSAMEHIEHFQGRLRLNGWGDEQYKLWVQRCTTTGMRRLAAEVERSCDFQGQLLSVE